LEGVFEAVAVRLAVMEEVMVGVELWVTDRVDGGVNVPVLVKEEVRVPELVRLGVLVMAALTVLEEVSELVGLVVPVSVPVTEIV